MNVGLIGCGKVGTTLCYLLKKNHRIVGVYDINKQHERRAHKVLHLTRNPDLETLCRKSTVLFIATSDDQIAHAFHAIRPYCTGITYVYHFSGLLPSTIFTRTKHIYRGSIHPFASFPFIIIPPERSLYPLLVEGDDAAVRTAARLFTGPRFSTSRIHRHHKILYHLIGVFSSNFLIGLLYAVRALSRKLPGHKGAFDGAVVSIMKETIDNVDQYGLDSALSGPVQRGDTGTIRKHLELLKHMPDLRAVYRTLSLITTSATKKGGARAALLKVLKK